MSLTLQERIDKAGPWFHNMCLDGIWTAPHHFLGNYPTVKWIRFANSLPENLRGKRVLDIGCNGGFYSIEMVRRGADYVLGIDTDPHYLEQARLAAELSGVKVDLKQLSVYEVGSLGQRFDLVIFMGVFYHLRHPLLALDLIREHVADDLFLFQSMQRGSDELLSNIQHDYPFEETAVFEQDAFPKLHFVEQSYCADPTNWWIPNRACVEAMLRSAGFCILDRPEEEVYLCRTSKREHPYD